MARTKQARVLFDMSNFGVKVGDILEADEKIINGLAKSGSVDSNSDAVDYAKSIGAKVVSSTDPAEALQAEIDALAKQLAAAADADKPAIQTTLDAKQAELAAL